VKTSENSLLKGLFLPVSKKQIPTVCIFGVQTNEFIKNHSKSEYFKAICRMPKEFTGRTRIEEFLVNCEGFGSDLCGSTSSTLMKDEGKIASSSNCLILLVLCRAIVPRAKQDSGFNPETQEYKINDFSMVYPEYVLICTKEKNTFEVVPNKHFVIPVKITELNLKDPNANKMGVETFYSCLNKAFENSSSQRNKMKSEVLSSFDSFWSSKFKKDSMVTAILESKKRFIERQRMEIENLKKELIIQQRFSDSLRQIKSTRFKTQGPNVS
jgi:hypothetical protein